MKRRINIVAVLLVAVSAWGAALRQPVKLLSPKARETFQARVSAPTVPNAPVSAAALPWTPTRGITLQWDASISQGVIGYTVLWGVASNNYTNSADVNGLSARVDGLVRGVTYYFIVEARDFTSFSLPSNEIIYTVPTADTYGVSVTIVQGSPGAWTPVITQPSITVTNTGDPMTLFTSKLDFWLKP